VLASVAVHLVLGAWALAHRGGTDFEPGQKPIVAKLVRLGEKRPESFLPRKEEAPAPPAPAPAAAPALPTPSAKAAPVLPGAKPKPAPAVAPSQGGKPGGDPLARVMSRLEREKAAEEPRWGDPTGDAEGDASEAGEGDRYLALAQRALQSNYRVPATISERERLHLSATVVLHVEPNGAIRDFKFERRSGNDAFDEALERAIRATRLPPPPQAMKDAYRRVGLGVNFHI
jgi:colicin import membrane protein/protein TonB